MTECSATVESNEELLLTGDAGGASMIHIKDMTGE